MSETIIREAKLFEAGKYPDKDLDVSESDLDAMVSRFPASGVPIRVQHGVSPWDGMMGRIVNVWRVGKELMGKVAWPVPVWDFLCAMGTKSLSVGLSKAKELVEVSVVDIPRVSTARAFADGMVFSFDMESKERGGYMPEYSLEVQAAIDAARALGKTEGSAEAKTQFDAQIGPLAKENADLKRSDARKDAGVKLAVWTSEGKLPPACSKFAEAILVDGTGAEVTFSDGGHMPVADAFVQFMTNLPQVVEIAGKKFENKDTEVSEDEEKLVGALGLTKEEYLAYNKEGE